ncbi:hypothetical protein [Oceanospirillum sanctuarii]|uniref:hypothetical protein n=1 Tax=Oceanospirillum sanctuarii TaxID=1434821 RepID=UPI000A36037B|nr:hypothetical protein [Oceanospirillum sanctuarii]
MLKNLWMIFLILPLTACLGENEEGNTDSDSSSVESDCKQGRYELTWPDGGASLKGSGFTVSGGEQHQIEVCKEDTVNFLPELLGMYSVYINKDEKLDCSMHHYNYSEVKYILHCTSSDQDYYFTVSSSNPAALGFRYEWDSDREYYMAYWQPKGEKDKTSTTLNFIILDQSNGFSLDITVGYEYPQ